MKISKEEIKSLYTIMSALRGREVSEVEFMRAMAFVYSLLSDAVAESEENLDEDIPSEADFFDKAVDMTLMSAKAIKEWEKKTGVLTQGMLLNIKIRPVADDVDGKLMVRVILDK